MYSLTLTLNGTPVSANIAEDLLLIDFIREHLKATGTHRACESAQCGACTILVDGKSIKSCIMLAIEAQDTHITTIEGIAKGKTLHPIQKAFVDHLGLQCGFCTPGMILTAIDILNRHPDPSEEIIRKELSGNFCRCTGYQKIVEAILSVSKTRSSNHV